MTIQDASTSKRRGSKPVVYGRMSGAEGSRGSALSPQARVGFAAKRRSLLGNDTKIGKSRLQG
jgi:hypothetical protein